MSHQSCLVFSAFYIPQVNCVVLTSIGNRATIWTERNSIDIGTGSESRLGFACIHIPQTDCAIPTPTRQCATVWTEHDRFNTKLMACDRLLGLASVYIP